MMRTRSRTPAMVLIAVTCAVAMASTFCAAESTVIRSEPTRPDLANPRTVASLVSFLVLVPALCVATILVSRRQKYFPIAGRGASYLLFTSGWMAFSATLFSALNLAWQDGLPCGMEYLYHFIFTVPIVVVYVIRAVTLVFRLEIMSFLAESRWREEKKLLLAHDAAARGDRIDTEAGDHSVTKDTDTVVTMKPPAAGNSDEDSPEVDDESGKLPGHFFIARRAWIEKRYLRPIVACFAVGIITIVALMAVFDPDPGLTTDRFRSRGLIPDDWSFGTQFDPDSFGSSPLCLVHSIKILTFLFIFGAILMPCLLWCAWRIILDRRRQAARKKDQAAVHLLVHGVKFAEKLAATKKGGLQLDDAVNVRNEMFLVVLVIAFFLLTFELSTFYAEALKMIQLMVTYLGLFLVTIVAPLRISYVVSRKHREMLGGTRSKAGAMVPTTRLPHQRPYFTLKYIMSNHYEVLLEFLQKEYSSENALFYSEARQFERAAKQLTARIPEWPSSHDADVGTGVSSVRSGTRALPSQTARLDAPATLIEMSTHSGAMTRQSSALGDEQETRMQAPTPSPVPPRARFKRAANWENLMDFPALHAEARRLSKQAKRMFRDYLARSALYEINIPEDLFKLVSSQLTQLAHWQPTPTTADGQLDESSAPLPPPFPLSTLYRQVCLSVFDLIQRDSFRRFILTPAFHSLLGEADEEELVRLENAGDIEADTQAALDQALSGPGSEAAILMQDTIPSDDANSQRVTTDVTQQDDGERMPLPGGVPDATESSHRHVITKKPRPVRLPGDGTAADLNLDTDDQSPTHHPNPLYQPSPSRPQTPAPQGP